jgi:hydroxymethylbilane synthase
MPPLLRLGTRGSQLALWQARLVARLIEERGGIACDIVVITTAGDRLAEARLAEIGGKRLFVKEIEEALRDGRIDLAVHSAKDMPVDLPDGLTIGAVLAREDPRDVVVLPGDRAGIPGGDVSQIVAALGSPARVGTSSVRRVAQLRRLMPGAAFRPVRGNLDTRLRKLDAGEADALILAAAGMRRLGFTARISATFPVEACTPAPGQGAIAVEIRGDAAGVARVVAPVADPVTWAAVRAERAVIARLGGGCQTPVGAVALPADGDLDLHGVVTSLDGSQALRARRRGPIEDPEGLGTRLADDLLEAGAGAVLDKVRRAQAQVEGIQP